MTTLAKTENPGQWQLGRDESLSISSMDVYMLGQSPLHMLSGSVSRDTDVGPIVILRHETAETRGVFHPGITIRTEQEAQNVITFLRMAFPELTSS